METQKTSNSQRNPEQQGNTVVTSKTALLTKTDAQTKKDIEIPFHTSPVGYCQENKQTNEDAAESRKQEHLRLLEM